MQLIATKELSIHVMTVDEWLTIPDFPVPRRTPGSWASALKGHLRDFSSSHAIVAMVQIRGGGAFKLDGVTRSLGWQTNSICRPEKLIVMVIDAADLPAAIELRNTFDSPEAVRTHNDRAYGAARHLGLLAECPNWFKMNGFAAGAAVKAEAIRSPNLERPVDIAAAMTEHRDGLAALYALVRSPQRFPTKVITAFLLSYKRHAGTPMGAACNEFWRNYRDSSFHKDGNEIDGVGMLSQIVLLQPSEEIRTFVGRALACVDGYVAGKRFRRMPSALPVDRYSKESIPSSV